MMRNLNLTRLDILEGRIWEALKKRLPIDEEQKNWEHTLQFINVIDRNRRSFKRFLKAYVSGDKGYLQAHPEPSLAEKT